MEEVESKKVKAKIPVKLTVHEKAAITDRLFALEREKNRAMEEYIGHRKHYQIRMSEIREKQATIHQELEAGVTEKEVVCVQTFFHTKKLVRFTDARSGIVLHERPMTSEELEPELFHPDPEKEECSTKACIKCGEDWFGGDFKQICHNCKKLEEYRFGGGA